MGRRDERDSKFLRLTGLWETKKGGLFTGKLRLEDIPKLLEKADEADKDGKELVFFLWANDKKSRKDPDFTLQVAIAEDQENSRGSSRGRGRGRGREEREPEPKEERSSRRSSREPEPEPRSSRGKGGKKDSDW